MKINARISIKSNLGAISIELIIKSVFFKVSLRFVVDSSTDKNDFISLYHIENKEYGILKISKNPI